MRRSATPPWRLNGSEPEAAPEQSLEAAVAGSIQSLQGTLIDCQAHLVEQVNMQLRARMLPIPPPPSTSLLPIPPPPPLPRVPHSNDSSKGGNIKGGWRPKAAWEWRDHDKAIGKPAAERRNRKCKTVEGRERFQVEQQLRHNNRFQVRLAAVVTSVDSSSSSDAPCALPAEVATELPTVKEDDNGIDSGDHVTVDPYMEVEEDLPRSLNKRAKLIAAFSKAIKNEHDAM